MTIKINTKKVTYIIILSNIEKTDFIRMRRHFPTIFPSADRGP